MDDIKINIVSNIFINLFDKKIKKEYNYLSLKNTSYNTYSIKIIDMDLYKIIIYYDYDEKFIITDIYRNDPSIKEDLFMDSISKLHMYDNRLIYNSKSYKKSEIENYVRIFVIIPLLEDIKRNIYVIKLSGISNYIKNNNILVKKIEELATIASQLNIIPLDTDIKVDTYIEVDRAIDYVIVYLKTELERIELENKYKNIMKKNVK